MSLCQVLVVDDDPTVRKIVSSILAKADIEAVTAEDGETGLALAAAQTFPVAILDLNLPGLSGIETAEALRKKDKELEIIILTGYPSLETSLEGHRLQIFDYLCKPIRAALLLQTVHLAHERRRLVLENRQLVSRLEGQRDGLQERVKETEELLEKNVAVTAALVGLSREMVPVRKLIQSVAPSDATVLIRGESGTGKEIVARLMHELSGRKKHGDFVKINCPAIPEALLESEIFGHEKGSFTGADRSKPGRFELATGGTVFLDEIGDLPPGSQAKLLQVLEHKEFHRVGGVKPIQVNARIVAATNAPLERLIAEGKFRADLFYRLNHFVINLPPLRNRTEDIPLLVDHFLSRNEHRKVDTGLPPQVLSQLVSYDWPGNVRELKFIVDRFVLTGDENQVLASFPNNHKNKPNPLESKNQITENEAALIHKTLVEEHWNQRKTASKLGISYSALRRRIDRYGLKSRPISFDA